MADVTQILSQIESGDPGAAAQSLPLAYDELRKLVAARLAQEKPGQTLQRSRSRRCALTGGWRGSSRLEKLLVRDSNLRQADYQMMAPLRGQEAATTKSVSNS